MTDAQAAIILAGMNAWRRGEPPYDGDEPTKSPYLPKEFGEAIDHAIKVLSPF